MEKKVWAGYDTFPSTEYEAFFYSRCKEVIDKRLLTMQASIPEQQLGTALIEEASIYPRSESIDLLLSSTLFTIPGLSLESLVTIEKTLRATLRMEDFEVRLVVAKPVWGAMYLRVYLTDLKLLQERAKKLSIKLVV